MTDAAIIKGLRELCQWHEKNLLTVEAENRRLIAENDALGDLLADFLCEVFDLETEIERLKTPMSDEEFAKKKNEYLEFLEQKALKMQPIWDKNSPKY